MAQAIRMSDIQDKLDIVAKDNNVTILHASICGSRAWGLNTIDADYDISIVYKHSLEDYLSVFPGTDHRNSIDRKFDGIEIHGWDVRRMFQLLLGSNPGVLTAMRAPAIAVNGAAFYEPNHLRYLDHQVFITPKTSYYAARGQQHSYTKAYHKAEKGSFKRTKELSRIALTTLEALYMYYFCKLLPMPCMTVPSELAPFLNQSTVKGINELFVRRRLGDCYDDPTLAAILDDSLPEHHLHRNHTWPQRANEEVLVKDVNDTLIRLIRGD